MLHLSSQATAGSSGEATMTVFCPKETIYFNFTHGDKYFCFEIEKEEWEQFKTFIEQAMERDKEQP